VLVRVILFSSARGIQRLERLLEASARAARRPDPYGLKLNFIRINFIVPRSDLGVVVCFAARSSRHERAESERSHLFDTQTFIPEE
jgi:hypothetical protein